MVHSFFKYWQNTNHLKPLMSVRKHDFSMLQPCALVERRVDSLIHGTCDAFRIHRSHFLFRKGGWPPKLPQKGRICCVSDYRWKLKKKTYWLHVKLLSGNSFDKNPTNLRNIFLMAFFTDRLLTVIRGHHFKLTGPTVNSRPININDILFNRIILPVIIPEMSLFPR